MPVQIRDSILESNQEEVRALAHHKPQFCAVDDHLPHHKHQFVPWASMCFMSQEKDG